MSTTPVSGGREPTAAEIAAAVVVAEHSGDAADCRALLDALGLLTATRRHTGPAFPHGHVRGYWRGCRCAACTAAVGAYQRMYRDRLRADPAAADRAGHGRTLTYRAYGCRCDRCRAAQARARREERERHRALTAAAP